MPKTFTVFVNQGNRDAVVVATIGDKFLYEYEMPNGSSALRNQNDRPVSYRSLSIKWLRAIENQFGLSNLIARPQQCGRRDICQEMISRLEASDESS